MRRVYFAPNSTDAYVAQTYLEANGIQSVVVNEHRSSDSNGTSVVFVVNDEDEAEALQLIEDRKLPPPDYPPWQCKNCREENEGAFGICWKCGGPAPPLPAGS
ncbi:MAG: DUF2007 domain-containing protein [Polyangiaceae bacterium]